MPVAAGLQPTSAHTVVVVGMGGLEFSSPPPDIGRRQRWGGRAGDDSLVVGMVLLLGRGGEAITLAMSAVIWQWLFFCARRFTCVRIIQTLRDPVPAFLEA